MNATARIGVDVGGTFTDFVLHDPARNLVATGKRLTTPDCAWHDAGDEYHH